MRSKRTNNLKQFSKHPIHSILHLLEKSSTTSQTGCLFAERQKRPEVFINKKTWNGTSLGNLARWTETTRYFTSREETGSGMSADGKHGQFRGKLWPLEQKLQIGPAAADLGKSVSFICTAIATVENKQECFRNVSPLSNMAQLKPCVVKYHRYLGLGHRELCSTRSTYCLWHRNNKLSIHKVEHTRSTGAFPSPDPLGRQSQQA